MVEFDLYSNSKTNKIFILTIVEDLPTIHLCNFHLQSAHSLLLKVCIADSTSTSYIYVYKWKETQTHELTFTVELGPTPNWKILREKTSRYCPLTIFCHQLHLAMCLAFKETTFSSLATSNRSKSLGFSL